MNLHVPQSVEAEIEIMVNSRCANHIVSSQSNAPVNGPVQDALVGIYMLTRHWDNGTITLVSKRTALKIYLEMEISNEDVQNLWQRAKEYYPEYIIEDDGKLTIQEEIPGNLFVSILFPRDLCYSRTIENQNPKYTQVEIEDGVLLAESCHLCAKTAGGKPNSIVHILWKQSPELCLRFMSNLQQLTDRWLMTHGFSMGIADCYASKSAAVAQTLLETRSQVDEVLNNPPENKSPAQIEGIIQTILNGAMNIGPKLAKDSMMKDDFNALNIMRNSGAKGSVINLSQIVAMVGQQNIKGCRMPQQLSHGSRCLPSFLKGDNTPDARGFVEHNYIQGLTPQEAFFHAAAGRDGVISTALKSVTGETPVIITENGVSKYYKIGDWIDTLLAENPRDVQPFTEREMELMDVSHLNLRIPTTDEKGNVTWGEIKNITRHDPGQMLYKIKTQSGRSVIVTESKALLVWDSNLKEFIQKDTPSVKIGDFAPTTMRLVTETSISYLDMAKFFPKSDYIHGNDFLKAKTLLEDILKLSRSGKVPCGWWDKVNGTDFILPYDRIQTFRRVLVRSEISNIHENCIYPFGASREVQLPSKFDLDYENGVFIGLFLAEGNADIPSGYVAITNCDPVIRDFVKKWFEKYSIKFSETFKINHIGGRSEGVRGFSRLLAVFLTKFVGHGARNKYIPDEIFTGPEEFIKGLINGYISGDGCIKRNSIEAASASPRLIEGINTLLSRFGIFAKTNVSIVTENNLGTLNIAPSTCLSIRGQWASLFRDVFTDILSNDKNTNLKNILPTQKHINYVEQNDVVLDKIIEIQKIEVSEYIQKYPQYKGKVYDLTVPSTLNFGLANGLHVVDTADTGYLQKRMGRKLEDAKVWSDGSIRDANGSVISFLYGDDGMEAKKLVPVKGLNAPFFVNPYLLARQLNSQVKQSQALDKGRIRSLSSEEIQFMCEYINFSHIQSDPILLATQNTRDTLSKLLKNVQIYESKIADFIVEIKNAYDNSKAPYGYAAGLVSTSSLGEPNSQSTLNVFHLTGVGSGKSESVGVARFRELINATKTLKQAHPGCSIYFKDQTLVQNSKLISQLEDQNKTQPSSEIENQIKTVKEESLRYIESKANVFEQTYVKQFLKDYELKYLPIDTIAPEHSPMELFTYQEYKEEWWVTLSKKLGVNEKENFKDVAKSWVLVLYFDVEKLYKARIDLEDISFAIEDTSMCALSCIISPTNIGRIEVYADIEQIRSHMKLKFTNKVDSIITPENLAYYIMRDPITKFVKNTRITGVEGVVKTYSREELSTHEWIMDTDGANFLDILTMPNVDTVRTMTNDMHEILKVLGVEAARRFEFEEITRVISYDGTYINPRHISTLVDVMTASGGLTAASRDGISRDVVGPNAKIMFEKSVDNAMIASAFGDVDNMTSLASSVMFGKVAITGSKMVEICTHNSLGRQPPLKVKTIPLKTRK